MQAGFISVMGFWVGGYGGFTASAPFTEVVTIAGLSLANTATISGLRLELQVTIDNLAVGS